MSTQLHFLSERIFKVNPAYELVESGHLDQPEQNLLAGLLTNEDVFGVFRPHKSHEKLNYKVAYKDVALLYYFLVHPSKLPLHLRNGFDDEMNNVVATLVLDGILEIEQDGNFYSGIGARDIIFKGNRREDAGSRSYISKLSEDAIRYAMALKNADMPTLTTRLYTYNTIPTIQKKFDDLKSADDVQNYLWADDHECSSVLDRKWTRQEPSKKYNWLSWSRASNLALNVQGTDHRTYKLYISPRIEEMPDVFKKAIRIISSTGAFNFKIGADRHGLVRPDKFIIYFNSYDHLEEAATILKDELKGYRSQGVPFTSQIDEHGLLSWGIDPARKDVLENIEAGSWREKVSVKLASVILQTNATNNKDPLPYIMDRMILEKIDPTSWTPA